MIKEDRARRKRKIRSKVSGTGKRPRLTVYKSNQYIYAQLIDDVGGKTIAAVSDKDMKKKGTKSERSRIVGEELAKLAKAKKINEVVFDRAGFKYHGRVKELAEGAREGGLDF